MAPREPSSFAPAWAKRRVITAGAAAVILAAGAAIALVVTIGNGASAHHAGSNAKTAGLASSACTGPTGAAYIALPGYQAFDAVDTANCALIQQYNVGDRLVPNTGTTDFNYDSSEEGLAMYGSTLYFADTGNDTLAIMDSATLNVDNYENPAETLIHVGADPEGLAVTPDGSQVWVLDTGPQTGDAPTSLGAISLVSTSTDAVTATLRLPSTDPREIAFSPSGATAYVTSGDGLLVINTATLKVVDVIRHLGSPQGVVVSPDGSTVYVTSTALDQVDVISAATNTVTGTIKVGQLPWSLALSPNGGTLYVTDPDSDAVSVINTSSGQVTATITDSGDPVSVAVTPDGSELWVGGLTSGIVTVYNTSNDSAVGSFNVGYGGEPNAGDGEEPTAIVLTTTPTPGS